MKPRVYAVIVFVRWHHPELPVAAERVTTVRILAATEEQARIGAMNWAQSQPADTAKVQSGSKAFAYESEILFPMTEVDCIGESLK